jgi:hypothetical protein
MHNDDSSFHFGGS